MLNLLVGDIPTLNLVLRFEDVNLDEQSECRNNLGMLILEESTGCQQPRVFLNGEGTVKTRVDETHKNT